MNAKILRSVLLISSIIISFTTAGAYEEIEVREGGKIRGVIRVEGKLPRLPPLQISKHREVCQDVPNESVIIGPNSGLRNAVVTLEGITRGKPIEKEAAHDLDNVGCRFVPHVLAASVGQFVVLKNSDPVLHTAHSFFAGAQPGFNVGLYPGRISRKPLVAPGLVQIVCEVHPWMTAYIVVTEHPYHAVTDVYGEYWMTNIPAGEYQVRVWHESLGVLQKEIVIKAGEISDLDLIFVPISGVKK